MDSLELEQHSQQRSSIAFRSTEKLQAARGGAWGWRWTPAFWVLHIGGWRRDPWHWFREPSSMRNLWRFVGWRPSRVARNDNEPGSDRVFAYSNPTHGPGLATLTGPIINQIFFFGAQTCSTGPRLATWAQICPNQKKKKKKKIEAQSNVVCYFWLSLGSNTFPI